MSEPIPPTVPSIAPLTTATLGGMLITLIVSLFARTSCDFQLAGRVSEAPRLVQVSEAPPLVQTAHSDP
ncbi:hypothetical protein [Nannocystis pusilla]|uniref:Uncharacterized protein n=1 Tax=Nannocystis pusilla TaxID=889268 RepID=A0ABS7TVQ2_9BACT|nr:hypothetical protein [Nannocystis pusilla]MBZ5712111.1 hypothetical protein [Nannocystis pusilla]